MATEASIVVDTLIFNEGFAAYERGEAFVANPFEDEGWFWNRWRLGWLAAACALPKREVAPLTRTERFTGPYSDAWVA